jgi:hypothetical protein
MNYCYSPGRRVTTYATYDRPHLRPQKFNFFFGDPILFTICTSKIIDQAAARTITMGASDNTGLPHMQAYTYKFKRL